MGKAYYIKDEMNCESTYIIYSITCMKCLEQYIGSAIKFKSRFKIHKSDIKLKKIAVGIVGTLIINDLIPPISIYLCAQIIQNVYCIQDDYNIGHISWDREKYGQ